MLAQRSEILEVVMRSLLLFALLAAPVTAQAPSIDELLRAYAEAGWVILQPPAGDKLVCIGEREWRFVDRVVKIMADRAKGTQCL
jgi:hypothetical protein